MLPDECSTLCRRICRLRQLLLLHNGCRCGAHTLSDDTEGGCLELYPRISHDALALKEW